jgi:hypothetical protein
MSGKSSEPKRLHEIRLNPTPKMKSKDDGTNKVTPAAASAPKPDLAQADIRLLEEMLGRAHDPTPKAATLPSPPKSAPIIPPPAAPPAPALKPAVPELQKADATSKKPPEKETDVVQLTSKPRWRKVAFLLIGLLVGLGLIIGSLLSLPDSRNFLFSFTNLTQREERYYNEVTRLNSSAEQQLNQAYQPLLNNSPTLQQQAYKNIYVNFGEVSAKFLALDSPSLRFDYPHAQLRKVYLQYEALSKQMLQTLEIDPKTIDRKLILEQMGDIRKLLEQSKVELRSAANR